MKEDQKKRLTEKGGLPEVEYDGGRPMSITHINKLFRKGAQMLGLEVSVVKISQYYIN